MSSSRERLGEKQGFELIMRFLTQGQLSRVILPFVQSTLGLDSLVHQIRNGISAEQFKTKEETWILGTNGDSLWKTSTGP